jgi:two-component system sensor histidine kinase/response regulator
VTLVNNGQKAVAATVAQAFDLVLMDVQMPEMDGLEAAAQIRAREQQTGTHLPIIAMTAHALKGDRERCLEAGMDSYVAKPIRAEELFGTIDAIFSHRERDSAAGAAILQDVVNWTEASKTAQSNRKVLKSITEAALEEIPQLMTAIRRAIASSDGDKLKFAAHTLRGSMRCFGANRACEHAATLEEMGRKGELEDARTIAAALEEDLAHVAAVLSDYLRGN